MTPQSEPAPDFDAETGEIREDAPDRRPFAALLQEARNGGLHQELSEAISEVAVAVVEHQKQGKLVLTLTVAPAAGGSAFITDDVKSSPPEGEKLRSLFVLSLSPFVGEDPYRVEARLRHRINSGDLRIGYRLDRPDDVKRDALEQIAKRIRDEFANVYIGEPAPARR